MDTCEMVTRGRQWLAERPDRWGRGTYVDYEGKVCAVGACYAVALEELGFKVDYDGMEALEELSLTEVEHVRAKELWGAINSAESALNEVSRDRHCMGITSFNDTQATSVDDVLPIFDTTIEKECK